MGALTSFLESKRLFAPVVLRYTLAIVFILFGFQKLSNPAQTTGEIQLLLNFLGIGPASAMNYYLGLLELAIACLLILGYYTRLAGTAAALLTAAFFGSFLIKYGNSINPDIFRDVGLTGAGIGIALIGAGPWSLDNRKKNQENPIPPQ